MMIARQSKNFEDGGRIMLLSFDETCQKILEGRLLHIAGTEDLIKRLPKGNWIGGSTEYFMTNQGGTVSNEQLFITEFPYDSFKIDVYDEVTITNVAADAFDNGFSIVILPFDSTVHKIYAAKSPEFDGMFIKNIVGWISGLNLNKADQTPVVIDGKSGTCYTDKMVCLHIEVPEDKIVSIGIINIFEQDEDSPVFTFSEEGFCVKTCMVDGKEVILADYIEQNNIDTKSPFVGSYSGAGINISIKEIKDGAVYFYAPVFSGIQYKMAEPIANYIEEFNQRLGDITADNVVFSCNCILNFLYGELEGKDITALYGPITFGEIAYQLVNQTLVYITVS